MGILNSLTASSQLNNQFQSSTGPGGNLQDAGMNQSLGGGFTWSQGSGGGAGLISAIYCEERNLTSGQAESVNLAILSGKFSEYYQLFGFNLIKGLSLENIPNTGTASGSAQSTSIKFMNTHPASGLSNSGGYFHNLSSGSSIVVGLNGIWDYMDDTGQTVTSGSNSNLRAFNADLSGNNATYRITAFGATLSG